MKRIGLLGGTFDPPHIGHLLMAEEARLKMELDEIWWVPNRVPPHKEKTSRTTAMDRLDMVESMTKLNKCYKVCDIELKMEGPSYTVHTIEKLLEKYPDYSFYFIIGEDSLLTLQDWYGSDRLLAMVKFIVIRRPGYTYEEHETAPSITIIQGPVIDVSSTLIRETIYEKKLNKFLLTKEVYSLIEERGLYE
ncbi:nicotinate-nucleotide adenylyltransferase [Evansella sp. LMS18]|uniref:nicotinate-nucleotide adenylyltransferase n=1 Tax=Evansella sp. LMS18 TaxID=2924033 RepID=UPI0020CFE967|nr:nicotinate-nucleotide adenylyltransferase [Evansella sp. LMS18]UTR09325.1 nicotinate-nucleotide adenylyltransferase [Evansella sp. LMS18]